MQSDIKKLFFQKEVFDVVEQVESDGFLYALVIRKDYCPDGVNFFSSDDDIFNFYTI